MFKKIALATALIASASFATWDKFPVLEAGKGQAKVGMDYNMQGDWSGLDLYAGARYSVISNLELGLVLPYTIFTDDDCDDKICGDDPDGLKNLTIMARYQFMPAMNAFVDVDLPIGEEELADDGLGLHFGVQYSMPINEMISLGSEAGLWMATEGDDEVSPPWNLNVGAELDFAVMPQLTPYVGLDFNMHLGENTHDGDDIPGSDESGEIGIWLTLGAGYAINQMIGIDASFGMGFGEDYYGKDTPMVIDVNVKINF